MSSSYETRVCQNPSCRLRYPIKSDHEFGLRCPLCLSDTDIVTTRSLEVENNFSLNKPLKKIEVLIDNIRSAWNVGAIFRTADAMSVSRIHLCGITTTPDNHSVNKTALGASSTVDWTYSRNAVDTAKQLQTEGFYLLALEQTDQSVSVFSDLPDVKYPILLIVGNEVSGVDPDLLSLSDQIIDIPMLGKKRSLNVEVAFGIAISALRYCQNQLSE
jgi:23S rRNA (guanosine2251-2'-O)-methyltransferase